MYRALASCTNGCAGCRRSAAAGHGTGPSWEPKSPSAYERLTADELFASRWQGVKVEGRARDLHGPGRGRSFRPRGSWRTRRADALLRGGARCSADTISTRSAPCWSADRGTSTFQVRSSATATASSGSAEARHSAGRRTCGCRAPGRPGRAPDISGRPGERSTGAGLEMTSTWKGVALNAGIALPKDGLRGHGWDHAVVFATCSAANLRILIVARAARHEAVFASVCSRKRSSSSASDSSATVCEDLLAAAGHETSAGAGARRRGQRLPSCPGPWRPADRARCLPRRR